MSTTTPRSSASHCPRMIKSAVWSLHLPFSRSSRGLIWISLRFDLIHLLATKVNCFPNGGSDFVDKVKDEKGFLDLLVKKYPNGPMSTHLHEMQPGQSLDFKGPIPKYPWTPNKHIHVALIAGGTGITPMYQVVRTIFNNPDDKTKVTLVFANVKEEDILLKKEFDDLENTYPQRFRAFYVLDNPPKGWKGGKGFVSKELLKTVLPEPKEENIKVFVCGPPGMYKAISGVKKSPSDQGELDGSILEQLGYSKDQVYKF
jgi:cytochrome-b5 reductase